MPNFLVNTDKKLKNITDEIKTSPIIGLDTEFIRESTYFPKLALLQISTINNNYCMDILKITDDSILREIFLNNSIKKVIHSSKQDLESIFSHYECYPKNIFDTQIAFNFLFSESNPSYSKLVKKYFNVSLKEGSWRTNWLERPLSDEKIKYACDDVKYLINLYHILYEQLKKEKKLTWCEEEILNDLEINNVIVKPVDIWRRINFPNKINNNQMTILKKIAELREKDAIARNIPRKWVMTDSFIIKAAFCKLNDLDKVIVATKTKLSGEMHKKIREIILEYSKDSPNDGKLVDINKYHNQITKCNDVMDYISNQYNIAPSFIANKKDIENFARGNKNVRFLKGWRFNIFGKLVQ